MRSVYYNDNDPYCCKVLQKNIKHGNLPEGYVDGRDIRDVRASELVGYQHVHLFAGIGGFPLGFKWAGFPESIRIVTGGFPCQDISQANQFESLGLDGERSGLWAEYYKLICKLRPPYAIVENVSALLFRGLGTILADLARIRYDAEWRMLRACDFGLPHRRKRILIIAYPTGKRRRCILKSPLTFREQSSSYWKVWKNAQNSQMVLPCDVLSQAEQMLSESSVCGVDDGLPYRVDRLRGLGNALVPQIAQYIAACIMAYEQQQGKVEVA